MAALGPAAHVAIAARAHQRADVVPGDGTDGALDRQRERAVTSKARLALFDAQLVLAGAEAALAGFAAELVVFVIDLETVKESVLVRRDGDERFPTVGHAQSGAHFVRVKADDDVRHDAIVAKSLLSAVELHFDEILSARVAGQLGGGEIGDDFGGATREKNCQQANWNNSLNV